MMKKTLIVLFTLLSIQGFTQETTVETSMNMRTGNEMNTLFNNGRVTGGFLGLVSKPADLNGQPAYFAGAHAAVVIGHNFNIGIVGYGLISDVESNYTDIDQNPYYIETGYGGLFFEPVIGSNRVFHFSAPVILGAGVAGIHRYRYWDNYDYNDNEFVDSDLYFVVEPAVNLEVNVFKVLRIAAGVGYRYISDSNLFQMSNDDMSGFTGNITLKVGWF
jgi:hypothetical protein